MLNRVLVVLSYVGMGLVFVAVAVRILGWLNLVAVTPAMDQYAVYAALTGLVLVLLYTLGQWREVADYFRQRNARYGTLAAASVVLVLGILVAVNYLSQRHSKRWDLTENRQHSLSDQTVQLLRGLEAPVRFLVFEREMEFDRFRMRLNEYEYHSPQVQVEYIDPERQPIRAREHEVQVFGTVVVEHMGRTERVTSSSEQDLTNALIKLIDPQERKVYFLTGHGERAPSDSDRQGYSGIADALRRDNYEFDTIVLAQEIDVPPDASVVIAAGPRTDLLPLEADALRRYLNGGGKVLFLLDPPERSDASMPVLEALLQEWGFGIGRDVVVDISGVGQLLGTDASVSIAARYPAHPITERFELLTAFPMAQSITPIEGAMDGRFAESFVQTDPRSWAVKDITSLMRDGQVALDEARGDRPGPISIAAAVSVPVVEPSPDDPVDDETTADADESRPETRVAVVGDSDFATNAYLGIQGNSNLFMNTVNWLAQQENLIAIRPREAADRRITLTADRMNLIFVLSLLLVPAGVAGAGIYAWWRRR